VAKVNLGTNWIRDLWYDPCDPDPWIFLELAFPALVHAIWDYIQWDWEDLYEGTRGKSWQKDAKNVVKAKKFQRPTAMSKGLWLLFLAEAGVQRIGWMFLVAEIVANAFIRWSSLILSLPECNEEVTSLWGRSTSPIDGRPLSHDWMVGPSWTVEAGTMFPYIGARFVIPPGGSVYYTTFQRYAVFVTGTELIVTTQLVCIDNGTVYDESPPNDPNDEKNRSSALHEKVNNATENPLTMEFQVKLAEGQNPLVWNCIGDFVSIRIFEAHTNIPKITLPYLSLPQPSRRTAKPRPWNKKRSQST